MNPKLTLYRQRSNLTKLVLIFCSCRGCLSAIVLHDTEKKNMEFPTAFIGFDSNEAFVNVCLYCSDFDLMSWKSLSMAPIFCASLILKILMHAVFTVSWIHSVLKNMFSFELIPTKGKLVSWVFVLHLFGNAKKNFKFLVVKCKWYICIREINMYLQVFWFESLHKL